MAKTIGIPPIAPASFGPAVPAISRIIAVAIPEAMLLMSMSMVLFYHKRGKPVFSSWFFCRILVVVITLLQQALLPRLCS